MNATKELTREQEVAELDRAIKTLGRYAEQWSELGMDEEMKTTLAAFDLLRTVRDEIEEGVE